MLLERPATAVLALRHLRDYTPAIRRLGRLVVWASALDLPVEHTRAPTEEILAALEDPWRPGVSL